jgi:hypothetical protein
MVRYFLSQGKGVCTEDTKRKIEAIEMHILE